MTFWGYPRPDGSVGVRNHVAIISSVICANTVTSHIHHKVKYTIYSTIMWSWDEILAASVVILIEIAVFSYVLYILI